MSEGAGSWLEGNATHHQRHEDDEGTDVGWGGLVTRGILTAHWTQGDGYWHCRIEEIDRYGEGRTLREAIEDALQALIAWATDYICGKARQAQWSLMESWALAVTGVEAGHAGLCDLLGIEHEPVRADVRLLVAAPGFPLGAYGPAVEGVVVVDEAQALPGDLHRLHLGTAPALIGGLMLDQVPDGMQVSVVGVGEANGHEPVTGAGVSGGEVVGAVGGVRGGGAVVAHVGRVIHESIVHDAGEVEGRLEESEGMGAMLRITPGTESYDEGGTKPTALKGPPMYIGLGTVLLVIILWILLT